MKFIVSIFLLSFINSCYHPNPSNAIEELGEEVLKKKEGIDIRLTPIDETKDKEEKHAR